MSDVRPITVAQALKDPRALAWIELSEHLMAFALAEAERLDLPRDGLPGGLLGMGIGALRSSRYTRAEVVALAAELFDCMQQQEDGAAHGTD